MLRLKHGVRALGMKPEIVLAILVSEQVFASHGYNCIITSITDSDHMAGSLHHAGLAVDLRVKHLANPELASTIAQEIQEALGPGYDIVTHADHIHVEYDESK